MILDKNRLDRYSRISIIVYAAGAAINVWLFLFANHDFGNLAGALLFGVLISSQKAIDGWRESARMWQLAAQEWQESSACWRELAEGRRRDG